MRERPLSEDVQGFRRCCVEIAARHCRVDRPLASEEPSDIPLIFAEQNSAAIFGMALEMHEEAGFPLLHEHIDASIRRPRQGSITARGQRLLAHLVAAGMGNL